MGGARILFCGVTCIISTSGSAEDKRVLHLQIVNWFIFGA